MRTLYPFLVTQDSREIPGLPRAGRREETKSVLPSLRRNLTSPRLQGDITACDASTSANVPREDYFPRQAKKLLLTSSITRVVRIASGTAHQTK